MIVGVVSVDEVVADIIYVVLTIVAVVVVVTVVAVVIVAVSVVVVLRLNSCVIKDHAQAFYFALMKTVNSRVTKQKQTKSMSKIKAGSTFLWFPLLT